MENSGFFASIDHDRRYTDTFLADMLASLFGNGTYAGELSVRAGADEMAVYLAPGRAWIRGRHYQNTEELKLQIEQASGTESRYTAIIIRLNLTDRTIKALAVDGPGSADAPVKPNPTRDSDIYDLVVAYVSVAAGATYIRQADITDTRLDEDLCGIVTGLFEQVPTDDLLKQVEDWFLKYQETAEADLGEFETTFSAWFEEVKGQLSTDPAGHLQNQIDDLREQQTKALTITLTATDGKSMAGVSVAVNDTASGLPLKTFDYSGEPEVVRLTTGASYTVTAGTKEGYSTPRPVLGVLAEDGAVELSFKYGTRYGFKRTKADGGTESRIEYLFDAIGKTPVSVNLTDGTPNLGDWQEFIEQTVTPVMLNTDGTEAYELDRTDQTKRADGEPSDVSNANFDGNAMVRFGGPFKWVKRYEDAAAEYVIFCDTQFDDDYKAYAHTNNYGGIEDAFYWGMFKGSNVSNKLRSIADRAVMVSQTRNVEVQYAQANGEGYYTIYKSGWDYIFDLITLLGKSDDCQKTFGYGRCASGNSAGVNPGSLKNRGAFWGSSNQTSDVKALFVEGLWGNYWEGMAGMVIDTTNRIKTKMTPPYNFDGTRYTDTGVTPSGTSGGFVSSAHVTGESGYVPAVASGTGTTYYADGLWYANGPTYALVGGDWSLALLCGRAVSLSNPASYANANIGSRLSYIPQKARP